MKKNKLACSLVIFGGTGDLTHRKLLPAIYNLAKQEMLPKKFSLVAIGRQDKTNEDYREETYQAIKKHSRFKLDDKIWEQLKEHIYYHVMDFTNPNGYKDLNLFLNELDEEHLTNGNRVYYLAVAPDYFETIVQNIDISIEHAEDAWQRVVIEKPFGRDLDSAIQLNETIVDVFTEENTYRIDHYLGKEMLQNIMVIRFANLLFEPLWNNQYIEQVQISSSETLGVEKRGGYYEHSGAIRDMVQSHLLQLMSLIAMDKPDELTPNAIRDKKVKVLQEIKQLTKDDIKNYVIRGQYGASEDKKMIAYRDEERVDPKSTTETYVALKLEVNNKRWNGVPFYIRTGKRMPNKSTEIIIQFKQPHNHLYKDEEQLAPNLLVIHVQPKEGVFFQFNAKEPGTEPQIVPVQMDFCQNCQIGINSPEAYERLLLDVMKGDATLFARWDEVYYSWRFIDTILEAWNNEEPHFPNYASNTHGPKEADELLAKDGKQWINL
jgi:glucose-6-phosphate 1-dehydrogenase